MFIYLGKRLLLMIPTLFGVMLISFIITQFVPGGPVEQLVNELQGKNQLSEGSAGGWNLYQTHETLEPQHLEELKKLYGFDKPAYERFFLMMGNYVRFDFGESYMQHKQVIDLILEKLPVSLSLGGWTFVLTYLICIPLGIAKAVRDGSTFDIVTSTLILIGYAIPSFMLAVFLLVLFGGGSFFNLFPLGGLVSDHWQQLSFVEKIVDYLWHIALPIFSLMVGSLAIMTMLTKNSFIEEIRKQYVLTARAKGLSENIILYKHIFRNAILPIVAGFPATFVGLFLTGSLLIEIIFSLDGIGLLSYNSIMQRDYAVVLGTLFIFTLLMLIAKLITDMCYVLLDPRIQFEAIK